MNDMKPEEYCKKCFICGKYKAVKQELLYLNVGSGDRSFNIPLCSYCHYFIKTELF
jgi:hypothetical protein